MNGARHRYLEEIIRLIKSGEDLVIVSSDYAAPVLDSFRQEFPERFISVGIAEQNLIQISCGLALSGHRVVAYGKAPFPCIRALDQIRNSIALMNLPVQIVSVGTGFDVPEYGATHFSTEDMSIMRSIPNMEIITISDEWMAQKCAQYALRNQNPVYVRFDKYCDGEIYGGYNCPEWADGFGIAYRAEGKGPAIVTNNYYVNKIMGLAKKLWKEERVPSTVIDLFRLPFSQKNMANLLKDHTGIITVEEHVLRGGIGSEILELLVNNSIKLPLKRIGIDFGGQYPEVCGDRNYFLSRHGLSDRQLEESIQSFYQETSEIKG